MADECQHHGRVGSGHHGLTAQHAAHTRELIALRQAQGHAIGLKVFDAQIQGLYPGGEQVCKRLLELIGMDFKGAHGRLSKAAMGYFRFTMSELLQ